MGSPLHWLASRRVALISYTGRRSGRRFTIPVGYEIAGLQVTITVGSPERKVWWRSLTARGRRSSSLFAAAGEPVTPSRPEQETRRSFASRWLDDGRGRAALPSHPIPDAS